MYNDWVGAVETDLLGFLFDTARCNPYGTLSEQFSATVITHQESRKGLDVPVPAYFKFNSDHNTIHIVYIVKNYILRIHKSGQQPSYVEQDFNNFILSSEQLKYIW